jgi:mannose-1-phosphate guanylyltransferase/mannose-1-phosphate guanylyltransferase/mannose-6-phosphate isomerase
MFQQTVLRVTDPSRFTSPIIVGNRAHKDMLTSDLEAIGVKPATFVLEPEGRNTAPAITIAAMIALAARLGDTLLVMPSDHYIQDPAKLIAAIDKARAGARFGAFVTFGIAPHGPETSYGYIKQGDALPYPGLEGGAEADIYRVQRFVEKPPRHTAEAMLSEGGFYWNSGMFMLPVAEFLNEIKRLKPAILSGCQDSLAQGLVEGITVHPDPAVFSKIESISIDYAVMEHTARAAVVPTDPLWSDVGSWTAVWEISQRDQAQNVTVGDVILHDVSGAYVRSEGPITAVVGLNDVIVVNTGDAVIVASKSHAQDIRHIAEAVKKRSRLTAARENADPPLTDTASDTGLEAWQTFVKQAG